MSHHTRMSAQDTLEDIHRRVTAALPDAQVHATGGGGHFSISVVSSQFEGLRTLARKRLVYGAITELMTGADAPIHAVDRLDTSTP
jgi:acid stress-induced BolA-like protein IbaG/YrbA